MMKLTQILLFTFFIILSFLSKVSAQDALYIPGSVPFEYSRRPATDIIYNGKLLTPDELVKLRKQGVDLSSLNPAEDTELWKNNIGLPISAEADRTDLDLNREVQYISSLKSVTGTFRFTVKQKDARGQIRIYKILASQNAHATLLRKNLLRKIGYRVPPTTYAPKIKIQFSGEFSRKNFVTELTANTLGDSERWGISKDDTNTLVEMQDVLIFEANESFYNLSEGLIVGEVILGRRLLNSLIVPYSIMNVQESVNGFAWTAGRVFNEFLLLNTESPEAFSTPLEDAIWSLNRISQLTRQDFTEIVEKSYYPDEVGKLLVEKIISRRNWLIEKFKLSAAPLPIDEKVSYGQYLVEGELKKEVWDGHAARYAFQDPESPLSDVEIKAFFKSKLLSSAITSLSTKLDSAILNGTDIEKKIIEKQIAAAREQFLNFLRTGEVKKIPFGLFAFPTIEGDIFVSRDIIPGYYLGTENAIQLADTLDFSVAPGVFVGAVGLPTSIQLQAGAQVRLSRSYTHLRNIKSIRRALKEPFKNMLVSLLKKEYGHIFDVLLDPNYRELPVEEQQEKIKEMMTKFNEAMGAGDSFIISDNIGQDAFAGVSYGFSESISAQASLFASRMSVGRIHILKADENTIHIYKDRGDLLVRGISLGFKALVPIVTINFRKSTGTAQTKFVTLNINPDLEINPEFEKSVLAFRHVLLTNSTKQLHNDVTPYTIDHTFREKVSGVEILFLKSTGVKSTDRIQVTHPLGATRNFIKSSQGKLSGVDYQGLTINTINALLEEVLDVEDVGISNPGSGNPGDTFKGKSSSRTASFELELLNESGSTQFGAPFFDINYNWKGWKIKGRKMEELIDEINSKFGYEMFSRKDFLNTKNFQLYKIDVDVILYSEAIANLANVDIDRVVELLLAEGNFPNMGKHPSETLGAYHSRIKDKKSRIARFLKINHKKFIKYYKPGSEKKALEHAIKYISTLEMILPFPRFVELVGGEQNMFVFGQISAFREGEENGDLPVIANSLGRFGEDRPRGGLAELQENIGISSGEFYLYWLLEHFE